MLLIVAALALPAAHDIPGIEHIDQGRAPWCAAAAGLMGTARLGPVPPLKALVRTLPVSKDGIPFLELTDALRPLGVEALVVQLDIAGLRRALAADVPAILILQVGPRRHAVLATGYRPGEIRALDPADPGQSALTHEALRSSWPEGQAIVLPSATAQAGLPMKRWRRADRRYRALEWALRAERHPRPNADMLALYDRAVAADPSIVPIRFNRAQVYRALGRTPEACAELSGAPGFGPARRAHRAWRCGD